MTEKLRSHLKSEKGFTLIELLVVIAIIAILVVIVLVAINPVQRIADANKRTAESNSNQIGLAASSCITNSLIANDINGAVLLCNTFAKLQAGYTNLSAMPAGTTIAERPAACTTTCTDVCVASVVAGQSAFFTYTSGKVSSTGC